jgi:uncharacterized protein (DUF58 family)
LIVRNAGTRRSQMASVRDPFDQGQRSARFNLPPLAPSETAAAAYKAPTERRGLFEVGPLEIRLLDPFGLAGFPLVSAPKTTLVVYPRVELIGAPPASGGDLAGPTVGRRSTLAVMGEDFYALREYELGDDLRRVHWKATAKHDELMIRQEEVARQGRATVVLDLRQQVHTPDTLETAISAAASIVHSCFRSQLMVRLCSNDGTDSGFGAGASHIDAIFDHLAGAVAGDGPALTTALAALAREGATGTLTVVSTVRVAPAELAAVSTAKGFVDSTIALVDGWALGPGLAPGAAHAVQGATVVRLSVDQPLAEALAGGGSRSYQAAR